MNLPVVLDAAGLDALASSRPPELFRALLTEADRRGRDVLVPAVVCAEVCRGAPRTRAVEGALARQVGAILFAAAADTEASWTPMSSRCASTGVAAWL